MAVPLLAVVGGSVDAIVRLGLGVLVAAQTGNTILLAASLAQHRFIETIQSAVSLVGYVAGTALGAAVVARFANGNRMRAVRVVLLVELITLIALAAIWRVSIAGDGAPAGGQRAALIALAAFAMGLQSSAVLTMHVRPSTTYVTGTLTAFTTELVERDAIPGSQAMPAAEHATPARHERRATADDRPGIFMMDQPWVYGAAWFIYAIGALVGALLFQWAGFSALLLPVAAVGVVLAIERAPTPPPAPGS